MEKERKTNDLDYVCSTKGKMDLDTIFVEEIGQFGKYQIRMLLLAVVVAIFFGWTNEYLFTTARINTRCLIPECEERNQKNEYAPSWILNAVPGTSLSSFDNCQRYTSSSLIAPSNYTCPATLFDRNTLVSCDRYIYENTNTIVYDFDLACDEWRRTIVGSVRTLGSFFGLPIISYVSDRWGRRTALVVTSINAAWIGVTRTLVNSYYGFLLLHSLEAGLGSSYICVQILLMEVVGPNYRTTAVASLSTFYSIGQMILALLAWSVEDWRNLTLTLYIPQFLTLSYFWVMSESVRWYISKGLYRESENILKKIARVNGKTISKESLLTLKLNSEEDKRLSKENQDKKESLLLLLSQHKVMILRCFVTGVWLISATLIYFGLSINVVHISGNRFLNYAMVSAFEIPGCWLCVLLVNKTGRKPLLLFSCWICAACQVGYIFTPNDNHLTIISLFMIGKCTISMVINIVFVYIGELYPTPYRHRFYAASSMMGKIGTFIAPLTPAFGENVPYALFAGFAALSGSLTFIMPETLGTKLPDTMEEAANLGKNKSIR